MRNIAMIPHNFFGFFTGISCVRAKMLFGMYAPSEPHGEGNQGEIFPKGKGPKDEGRRARMTARRHSPLHNNEPELIDYFVSPLGSANQSALPE